MPRSRSAATALVVAATLPLLSLTGTADARTTPRVPDAAVKSLSQYTDQFLTPRTHFTMAADGSSGKTVGGAGIPNIDSVKSTIRTYYNADSTWIANKTSSPYINEMSSLLGKTAKQLKAMYAKSAKSGKKPAIVLDADDTTLWTYDMEDNAMHFNFDPALQDVWVQGQKFPATPAMTTLVNAADKAGCTLIGLTGRGAAQKDATLGNLAKVGYTGFTPENYYTKWATGQQPSYINCAAAKCTTIEYKSQTRAHVQSQGYTIIANFGDQFSDLIGGSALVPVKLPNPTYYLP